MSRTLVVCAHPDDEVLGAGATIHKLAERGEEVFVAVASSASPTREEGLTEECMKSHEILGVTEAVFGGFGCMEFDKENHYKMVQFVEGAIARYNPNTVVIHHPADIHPDHKALALYSLEAVRLPQRQIADVGRIRSVLFMEVPSSTDWSANASLRSFEPNAYSEVSEEDIDAKIAALEVYSGVVRKRPHPRSEAALRALLAFRGALFGVDNAEAFQTVLREEWYD